ncbi:MAG: DinB family protein [Bacteroidota bacterium]
MNNALINHIISQLQNNQSGKAWIGPTYQRMLEKIDEQNAFIRPLPELHSVAEVISHLTTWQKETIVKIRTGEGRLMDDCEENWYSNEFLEQKGWNTVIEEYKTSLNEIIALLKTKEDDFLDKHYYDADFKGNFPYSFVINGTLHHNLYHLGQIGIIVKYLKKMGKYY